MNRNLQILFIFWSLLGVAQGQQPSIQPSKSASTYDSCYIFIEFVTMADTLRAKIRKKYGIVQYELYKNINPNWEGWILPRCNAEELIKVLSAKEKMVIKQVGFNYIGLLDALPPVATKLNPFLAVAPNTGFFQKLSARILLSNWSFFRKKPIEKIHIAFLDAFKDTIQPAYVQFHTVVDGQTMSEAAAHGEFVYKNFKTYCDTNQMILHKITVCIDKNYITYRNVLQGIELYCVPNQVSIVNMSLVFKEIQKESEGGNFLVDCVKKLESSVLFICAVGNDNLDLDAASNEIHYCPAHLAAAENCKNVIAVGAVDAFKHFVYSNRGRKSVTIVTKAQFGGDCSSYATPIITGILARACAKKKRSPEECIAWLKAHARHKELPTQLGYIHGLDVRYDVNN